MTSIATAIDWNEWRERYDSLTFAKQRAFYDAVYEQFPEQARFSTEDLAALLAHIDWPVSVVELGGWNGEFAAKMLRDHAEILRWTNHEISSLAVDASVCTDPRFYAVALEDWYWAHDHAADVFVASHVIEHLKLEHVVRAVLATDCRWIYFQAPLSEEAVSWHNYRGSHILEVGWRELGETMADLGFGEIEALSQPHVRCYER